MNILLAKAALSFGFLAAAAAAAFWLRDEARARTAARWLDLPLCWVLTRLIPWLGIYVVAGYLPQSDVATAYWPHALAVLRGDLPYRDFECFFGPLFPYLLSLPVLLWEDPRGLVLFFSLLEAVTVALTIKAEALAPGTPARARWLALYFLAPGPLLFGVVGGQEDFLFWLAGLLLWQVLLRGREFGAGALTVLAVTLTKPLFVIPAALIFGLSRRRLHFLLGAVPLALGVLAILWFGTGRAFLSVLSQGNNISPPNVWIWLHWLSAGHIDIVQRGLSLALVLSIAAFGFVVFARRAPVLLASYRHFTAAWTLVFAIFMLFSLKSLGAYFAYFALPAFGLFMAQRNVRALALWMLMGAVAPVECSLWFRLGEPLITGLPASPAVWLEFALQGVQLVCLVVFAWSAACSLRDNKSPADASPLA
jgi:hypothetical protein